MINLPPPLEAMSRRERWVLWRYVTNDDGKRRKLPYDLDQRAGLGSVESPRTPRFGTFADAAALWALMPSVWSGVGFAPAINDSFAGLDFDDLPHPVWESLLGMTYCERSPSHVPTKGHAIVSLRPKDKQRLRGIRGIGGFELFSDSGFITVTGNALNALPVADVGARLVNLADGLNLWPKDNPLHTLTGRTVTPLEVGRIYEKIGRWVNAKQFFEMRDDWAATSTWATRAKSHGGPDRSDLMVKFVSYLVRAGARDPDLLWAIIKDSAVWRGYSTRENAESTLWCSIVPLVLAKQPAPPKSDGKPVLPSFMKS